MPYLFVLITIISTSLFAAPQNENNTKKNRINTSKSFTQQELDDFYKNADSNYQKIYLTLATFLKKERINPIRKKVLPQLLKEEKSLKSKYKNARSSKLKLEYRKRIHELENKIEIQENWLIYFQAYVIYNRAYIAKDNKKYKEAYKICSDIIKRYEEITHTSFPNLEADYIDKNGPIKL